MKRLLLVNPWIYDFKAFDFWMKPMGLLYVASMLRNSGYEVLLIDCLDRYHPLLLKEVSNLPKVDKYGRGKFYAEEIEKPEIFKNVKRIYKRYGMPKAVLHEILEDIEPPDVILVTSMMTYWYLGVKDTIKTIKEHFPETPVILGGIYATLCPDHAKEYSGADIVMPGFAEKNLFSFFPKFKPMEFEDLPFPAFDLYAKLDYACVLTARGCPFKCSYCAVPKLCNGFVYRNPDSVLDEIEYYKSLGVSHIAFYDDALLANPNFPSILDGIIQRGLKLSYHTPNGLHPRFIDQEMAYKLFEAGYKTLYLSLETVDPKVQKATGAKVTNNEFVRAVEFLKSAGFQNEQIHTYLLIGTPYDSYESIRSSIDFVHSLGSYAHLAEYSPIPGTLDYAKIGFSLDTDPLLHNNTIFPAINAKKRKEMERIKIYLSRLRNDAIK
uniref:Radical SAM protein n=1 Tax=candidate division WOR-3 bacterium TaxID=2052148 RepID=A0A7C6EAZ2_UNCW3